MKKFRTKFVDVYIFILILTTINRVFLPAGIDLRFVLFPLGCVILIQDLIYKDCKLKKSNREMIALYSFAILSSLNTIRNFDNPQFDKILNMVLLLLSVLSTLLIINLHRESISRKKINVYFSISIGMLLFSMLFIQITGSMESIYGLKYPGWVQLENFYGQNFRIAGYAEDANQTSFWLIISAIIAFKIFRDKRVQFLILSIIIYFYMLSASKTVLLGLFIGLVYIGLKWAVENKLKISPKFVQLGFVFGTPLIMILMLILGFEYLPFKNMDTMITRYNLWLQSIGLFKNHFLIGAGITSFRHSMYLHAEWFVQAHSTIFQLIGELGVFGLFLYLQYFNKLLTKNEEKFKETLILIVIFVFSFTFEILYLPFIAFIDLYVND